MSGFKDWSNGSVGLELTHDSVVAACVDKSEKVIGTTVFTGLKDASAFDRLTAAISAIVSSAPETKTIGVALPGLINRAEGLIAHSTVIDFDRADSLTDALFEQTGVRVALENDANAAAIAEMRIGAGRGAENMFYATLGEGIGGAIVVNRQIWRGDSGYAGEFGNISVNSEGMRLEEIASARSVVRRTRSRFRQDGTSSLSKLKENEITIEAIVKAAVKEDDFAMMMLERTGTYVGTALATVINLLNIQRIVIGGSVMQAGDTVLDSIRRRAGELAYGPAFENTTFAIGQLGREAAATGAAMALLGNGEDGK